MRSDLYISSRRVIGITLHQSRGRTNRVKVVSDNIRRKEQHSRTLASCVAHIDKARSHPIGCLISPSIQLRHRGPVIDRYFLGGTGADGGWDGGERRERGKRAMRRPAANACTRACVRACSLSRSLARSRGHKSADRWLVAGAQVSILKHNVSN